MRASLDCICAKGQQPYCAMCVWAIAVKMRYDHPETLSPSMLRRRVPKLDGYVAAILVEATAALPSRNGKE